jgi:hypothetical protein
MQKIQNYVKATAALLIFFFVYDFIHHTNNTQVINPGEHVVIGGTTVSHTTHTGTSHTYVPHEGHVDVVVTTTSAHANESSTVHASTQATNTITTFIVHDKGWCKVPGIALVYTDTPLIQLDVKLFYYKRFSGAVGMNRQFFNVGLYRHVDDLIGLENLEFGVVGGIGWNGVQRTGVALRLNL